MRITRACADEVDGVSLGRFEVGLVYRVSASLGSYLVATGCAQALLEHEVRSVDEERREVRANVSRWREIAADSSGTRRRRKEP